MLKMEEHSPEDVVNVWKIFIDNEEVEQEVVDRILSGRDSPKEV